jgi:hypothetical protein
VIDWRKPARAGCVPAPAEANATVACRSGAGKGVVGSWRP